MSGLVKAAKKVFRGIVKAVKKIAIPVLAVAAVVFTGGAALGLAPMAGGFGAAVSGALAKVGIAGTGAIGSALTGAVTQAGYGAAIGGVASKAMGGSFTQGATTGAALGAVSGGVMGGLKGMAANPMAGVASQASNPATMSAKGLSAGLVDTGTATAPGATAPSAAASVASKGFASGLADFAKSAGGGQLIGSTVAGLGQGLMTGMAAKDEAEALDEHYNRVADSYSIDQSSAPETSTPGMRDPAQAYARDSKPQEGQRMRYVYDRESKSVVRKAVA